MNLFVYQYIIAVCGIPARLLILQAPLMNETIASMEGIMEILITLDKIIPIFIHFNNNNYNEQKLL